MAFSTSLWMCREIFTEVRKRLLSPADAMTKLTVSRSSFMCLLVGPHLTSDFVQTLQTAGVLQVSRTLASNIIYELRRIKESTSLDDSQPSIASCYELLLELHRAGSLAFSLEEVVREMACYSTEGSVE